MAFKSLGCFLHFLSPNRRVSLSDSPRNGFQDPPVYYSFLSFRICCTEYLPFNGFLRTKARSTHNLKGCSGFAAVVQLLSHVGFFATLWTVAHQTPLSVGFSRQEQWNGLPFPPPGDLPGSGSEPASPVLTGGFFTTEAPGKPYSGLADYKLFHHSMNSFREVLTLLAAASHLCHFISLHVTMT